jgi:hypothetical protein
VCRHEVSVGDAVPGFRQPQGVSTRPATDVGHGGRRERQVAAHLLLGSLELHTLEGSVETVAFQTREVVLQHMLGVARRRAIHPKLP